MSYNHTDKGGDPELVRESQRRRYADVTLVDRVIDLDTKWREAQGSLDTLRMDFNKLTNEIKEIRKAKQDATELQERSKAMKQGIKDAEESVKDLAEQRDAALLPIGNLVHDTVPISDDEANNVVAKTWGQPRQEEELYNHVDLVQLLGIVNLEQGTVVAGNRGYYLTGAGVLLNQALVNAALHFGYKRGFTPVHTPFFMQKQIMAECAQLSQFDEELYKVTGEGDEKYLIATAEQTLCALHRKDWFERGDLPKKYVGYSTCFRKEAGSHGRDTLGIFRVHQFEKVEQFCITSPHDNSSWEMMEEMLANAEDFYQSLGLPYNVVNIVSGELNNAAAKKYDVEAWFPASKTYRELVSCSNCLCYQSRRLDIRLRSNKIAADGNAAAVASSTKEYVHMLNSTLTATERTLCCVLENHQTPDGVVVPEVLRPYMMGIEFIPFIKKFDAKGKLIDRVPATANGSVSMSTS
jgi:seryl-tRNA synthetase